MVSMDAVHVNMCSTKCSTDATATTTLATSDVAQTLPSKYIVDYPGEHNFEIIFSQPTVTPLRSVRWTYSPDLMKLFVDKDKACPVIFKVSLEPPAGSYIRAMPIFKKPEYIQEPVRRCPNHAGPPSEPSSKHLIVCSDSTANYKEDSTTGKMSVIMAYKTPQIGTEHTTYLLTFKCFSSCNSLNRREIQTVFTLENNGQVLGRQVIDVRVCACPGRDRMGEEKQQMEKQTSVGERDELLVNSLKRHRKDAASGPSKKQKVSGKTEEAVLPKPKPLKICDVQRTKRIVVVAATLDELRTRIQTEIVLTSKDFKVVLEEDCTKVEDEDYFQTLADNTVIMVVDKEAESSRGHVEVDGKLSSEETSQRLARVAKRIAANPAVLAKVELEKVSGKMEEADLPKPKPLKICDVQRTKRIGVVAATLDELRTRIQTKIVLTSKDFKVVLEEDCTRVEDEDYFQTLADNTVIMVVDKGERWTEEASFSLEAESSRGHVEVDGKLSSEKRLAQVAKRIAANPAVLAFLPKVELELVSDANINELQVLLHQTMDHAKFIQDACERRLNDMIKSDEATELLNLYHRAKTEKKEEPKIYTRRSQRKEGKATELPKLDHRAKTEKKEKPKKIARSCQRKEGKGTELLKLNYRAKNVRVKPQRQMAKKTL